MLGFVFSLSLQANKVYAHTLAYMYGYENGKGAGKAAYTDNTPCDGDGVNPYIVQFHGHSVNLTSTDSIDRCNSGYTKGWDSTCAQALSNPSAEHDIYGCPGVSNHRIDQQLDRDSCKLSGIA